MKSVRKFIFWVHLAGGLLAGLSIFTMCLTGACVAFSDEIIAWTEREARTIEPTAPGTPRLSLDALQAKVRDANPEARPNAITVSDDPTEPVIFTMGREAGSLYANPYTGEIKSAPTENHIRDALRFALQLHRWLAIGGEGRAVGQIINHTSNLVFLGLLLTGLYLWWPRKWSWRGFKAIAMLNRAYTGKARHYNQHNVFGLWCSIILIVLSLTAIPISYRWGGRLVYRLMGEEPPAGTGNPFAPPSMEIPRPTGNVRPLGPDAILAAARGALPAASELTIRLGGGMRGGRGGQGGGRPPGAGGEGRPAADTARGETRGGENRNQVQAITVSAKIPGTWPRTATDTVILNPYTGESVKVENYDDFSPARKTRVWMRYLHTGQALGWGGQLIAAIACIGGCLIVYTGFALSWRRFFGAKRKSVV